MTVWQVQDSNLGSFRDGFTVRSHWPLGQPAWVVCSRRSDLGKDSSCRGVVRHSVLRLGWSGRRLRRGSAWGVGRVRGLGSWGDRVHGRGGGARGLGIPVRGWGGRR